MEPEVRRVAASHERLTTERCHILELCGAAADPRLSVARARVEPGVITARHTLTGVDERYLIVEGRGEVEIEGLDGWTEVAPGDLVVIPAGRTQRIRNTGRADLIFYCLCTPPFTESCYRQLETET
jgi:mannose-6-phosphate isomerase-like protein (cupin superfamily)